MKGIEQYFPVALFIMLYKVALTFEFADEILKSDYAKESIELDVPDTALDFSKVSSSLPNFKIIITVCILQ